MADDRIFRLKIISPDRLFYEGDITMVELKTSEGEIGIYKGHIPLTTILVPGIVRITEPNEVKLAALYSGFVEILKDKVTILAEVAEWPYEIDVNRAMEAKIRAERRINNSDNEVDEIRAEMALRRALTRIELGGK
ncbi:F-type H+-transporting ATPase subunit epsilon [Lachnotalea glycerini]|uniref:ATP synthase epsilon chain n=1 Tax=Lachnotalea glycerini TaxID=1763509 RepID=A0A255IJQ9_9FIRM|nr:ATP synthase F1 subunit epsilon [Lachnotalea glycerini]PXV91768.1 F-type H+-transporting ATPase subunit epsilon [Lachnotalea glycerini]RDY27946.1 ATP synthase F1 subunit epsilon [Lachnotalea glycerini]